MDSMNKKSIKIDKLKINSSLETTKKHLDAGINWFISNQKLQPDNGISSHLEFNFGKLKLCESFPEVTGYIIPTLFEYNRFFKNKKVFDSAVNAAEWELTLQNQDGSFSGGVISDKMGPSVFNTAQIVHGLIRAYQ